MKRLIVAIAAVGALLVAGCTTTEPTVKYITFNENQSFDATEGKYSVDVKWVRLEHNELQKKCSMVTGVWHSGKESYVGCAAYTRDFCIVYTGVQTTHQILGHEIRHCFQGAFHE